MHQKQSAKAKKKFTSAAQSQKKYFLPPQSYQLSTTEKQLTESHFRPRIPTQPHHGRRSTMPWIEKEESDGRVFRLGVQEVNNSKRSVNWILKSKDENFVSISATVFAEFTSNLPLHQVNVSGWTKTSRRQSCGPKHQLVIQCRLGNWSRTQWIVADGRQRNQGASKTNYLPLILFWLARHWTWEPNWKKNIQLQSFSFVLKQITYSNFGKWRIFQQQHSEHQMNINQKITSNVLPEETQREDSLWNSLSKRTHTPEWLVSRNIYNI